MSLAEYIYSHHNITITGCTILTKGLSFSLVLYIAVHCFASLTSLGRLFGTKFCVSESYVGWLYIVKPHTQKHKLVEYLKRINSTNKPNISLPLCTHFIYCREKRRRRNFVSSGIGNETKRNDILQIYWHYVILIPIKFTIKQFCFVFIVKEFVCRRFWCLPFFNFFFIDFYLVCST